MRCVYAYVRGGVCLRMGECECVWGVCVGERERESKSGYIMYNEVKSKCEWQKDYNEKEEKGDKGLDEKFWHYSIRGPL